jgi:thymidylate synthase (FAD)
MDSPPSYLPKTEEEAGEKILRMLLKKRHFGPLEHPHATVEVVGFPHSVAVQARTHRIAFCLDEDTRIQFSRKPQKRGRRVQNYSVPLKDLANLWFNGIKDQRDPYFGRHYVRDKRLRYFNPSTKKIEYTNITNIYNTGVKTLYKVSTEGNNFIQGSEDHKILTTNSDLSSFEWKEIKNLTTEDYAIRMSYKPNNPPVKEDITFTEEQLESEEWRPVVGFERYYQVSNLGRLRSLFDSEPKLKSVVTGPTGYKYASLHRKEIIYLHTEVLKAFVGPPPEGKNKALHKDDNRKNNCLSNLYWGDSSDNQADLTRNAGGRSFQPVPAKIISIECVGEKQTYDIEVKSKYRNFFANNLVVHNSFDVQSQRYTGKRVVDLINIFLELFPDRDPNGEGRRLIISKLLQNEELSEKERHFVDQLQKVFYVRPAGKYHNRQGKRYEVSEEEVLKRYFFNKISSSLDYYDLVVTKGVAEEDARDDLPQGIRQGFFMTFNLRSLMHFLDMRYKADAQPEIIYLGELLIEFFKVWAGPVAEFYIKNRANKNNVAP